MLHSRKTVAVPPGATIREQLEYHGITRKEFAARMEMTRTQVQGLIRGEEELTSQTARRLERVLGISAAFWDRLEKSYRKDVATATAENERTQNGVRMS